MIQETVHRTRSWIPYERTWIVTNTTQAAETSRQLPEISESQILTEPCARNTAPCIGLAAIHLLERDPDAVMLVCPADHVIRPPEVFQAAVEQAVAMLESRPKSFVLFGVPPTYPSTGFGYIERGQPWSDKNDGVYRVRSFREKPNRETAVEYVDGGSFYWNCGIFLWRADQILAALKEFEPRMYARLIKLQATIGTADWDSLLSTEFPAMKSISIDYAVLEQATDVSVLEAPFEWDDVGSWQALSRLLGSDENENTIDSRHCQVDTRGCIVRSTEEGHLIATIGLEDCIVVHTADATLVARKDNENAIRELVAKLEEEGLEQYL